MTKIFDITKYFQTLTDLVLWILLEISSSSKIFVMTSVSAWRRFISVTTQARFSFMPTSRNPLITLRTILIYTSVFYNTQKINSQPAYLHTVLHIVMLLLLLHILHKLATFCPPLINLSLTPPTSAKDLSVMRPTISNELPVNNRGLRNWFLTFGSVTKNRGIG